MSRFYSMQIKPQLNLINVIENGLLGEKREQLFWKLEITTAKMKN